MLYEIHFPLVSRVPAIFQQGHSCSICKCRIFCTEANRSSISSIICWLSAAPRHLQLRHANMSESYCHKLYPQHHRCTISSHLYVLDTITVICQCQGHGLLSCTFHSPQLLRIRIISKCGRFTQSDKAFIIDPAYCVLAPMSEGLRLALSRCEL